jgi:alpha-L-arabinofuranosidase
MWAILLLAAALAASAQTIRVTNREMAAKPVNRLIYGNFIESGFGRQVDGMRAEMLFNRSFEKTPPQKRSWMKYAENTDLARLPWWHSGYEESEWKLVPGNPDADFLTSAHMGFHHGKLSANLINSSPNKPASLIQEGLYLRHGVRYAFRGFVRQGRGARPAAVVTVALAKPGGVERLAQKEATLSAEGWTEIAAEFLNSEYEGRAALMISIPPQSGIFLDDLSLMPADNIGGWRRDVIDLLERVRPSIIRFPGGCFATFYHWRDGVGPRSERRPQESDFWGGLEYNDSGTDEFVQLCRRVGSEPFPVINMMSGTPEEAADWVAYCNAPAGHPMGKLRAANGHAEAYGVKYWELHNETYRKWSATEYARECIRFSKAMKAVDPSIQLVACNYGPFAQATEAILEIAGRDIDLLSDRAKGERHLQKKISILREYNRRTGRSVRLCNTEWLAPWTETDPDSDLPGIGLINAQERAIPAKERLPLQEKQISWRYAMNAASTLLMFQRLGGDFEFANFNNMANSWGQNVIECPKEKAFLSAAGRVLELFSQSPAAWPLELEGYKKDFEFQVQAAFSADRKRVVLTLLNYKSQPAEARFDLTALGLKLRSASVAELRADSPMAHNTPSNPDAVRRREYREEVKAAAEFKLTAPPLSVVQAVLN